MKWLTNSFFLSVSLSVLISAAMLPQPATAQDADEADGTLQKVQAPEEANLVPQTELAKLASIVQIPRGTAPSDAIEILKRDAPKAIEAGRAIEQKYPDAENLHEIQGFMLRMAATLADQTDDKQWDAAVKDIADRMLKGDPPAEVVAFVKYFLTRHRIVAENLQNQAIDKAIQGYVASMKDTPAAHQGLMMGIALAAENQRSELIEPMADTLEKQYLTSPGVAAFLKRQLKRDISFVGREFDATLTRLDGSKLTLPKDLKGKVVVVDFWATWCGPCIASLPHMKDFYKEYKDKGVEVVGISLDQPNKLDELKTFINEKDLPWIHTYSGKFWNDPTAASYGISGIPSVWVLDKQGRIYSENARGREGAVVDEILAGKTAAEKAAEK